MSTESSDRSQVERRAEYLLPEERAVGSEDPLAQAEAILTESDRRTAGLPAGRGSEVEHRTSEQTVSPTD
ncbi:hypothetical protein [Micromonospora sp. NBC_01796]|uniref:hypothetical protein n=1 Tax=Micromonospora sp. NBC_01796 TaxID=2975987 RepID=UPI002DDC2807|nr:hypothetical protein [Micromonospora sp. NBC_01796]WSA86599.1 hypothetical protein OIE47_02955 [Micromonospora sp. NBC_01796]